MAENFVSGKGLGVDVVLSDRDKETPLCPHGPTLIFERYFKDKSSRKFFACSASRDRKGCPFFQWTDEKITSGKLLLQNEIKEKLQAEKEEVEEYGKCRENLLIKGAGKAFFCVDCNLVIASGAKNHDNHNVKELSSSDWLEPSKFMTAAENKKTNAQYLFSDSTCDFIINLIISLGYEKIICLGVPRIHESIQKIKREREGQQDSILLDLDKRYAQFFPSSQFLHYNMFNNYFFGGSRSKTNLKDFLKNTDTSKVALVMDPPFGGLLSVLALSIRKLLRVTDVKDRDSPEQGSETPERGSETAIIMIFPYYLESHVAESFPSLKMMDYKICYKNHPTYKQKAKQSQRGSAIRIFTNVPGEKFSLPQNEGYRFCSDCKRYVAEENRHCDKCNSCTSKDGRTYVHCDLCTKCVKPGRLHCDVCSSCEEKNHKCSLKSKDPFSCHICGEIGHKRRDCPKKSPLKRSHSKERSEVNKKMKISAKKKGQSQRVRKSRK